MSRPPPHLCGTAVPVRFLAAFVVALAALPLGTLAHQRADHGATAPGAAPSAAAKPAQVQGRVGTIVVTSRVTGQKQTHRVLERSDGTRYLLKNANTLPIGATAAITGRTDGPVLWSDSASTIAAAPTAKTAPQRSELTGTLRMFHVDYTDGRPAEFGFALVTDAGRQNIVDLGTSLPGLENGMRATVAGIVDAQGYVHVDTIDILALPEKKPPRASANAVGPPVALTTGYLTMPLKYPNNAAAPWTYNADPFTIASITSSVYGVLPTQSVAEYFKEVSFGAQLVSGVVANATGTWLKATVARPTACSSSAELNAVLASIETQADAAATAASFPPGSYTGRLYVIDSLPCGWAGLGYIGWERSYTKGTASLGVVGHEFGHNFGLYHAGSLDCGTNVIAATGCNVTEYGDPFVIMGNNRSMHFSASQKELLGYISGGTIANHGAGSQTYTLGPIELPGQSQYAVRVPTGSANRTYWLEFRQPIGFDSGLSAFPTNGAQVRLAYPFEWNNCGGCATGMYDDTQFLDMTPTTPAFTDGALTVGKSYTDSTHNIVIDVLTATSSALTVKVTVAGAVTPSTTALASGTNPSTQGQSVTFTASVTGSAPTGTVAFRESGVALAGCGSVALTGSGDTRTATCASSTLAAGVHSLVADYGGDAGNSASSSVALSQTVKAATTTTVASSANPATAGLSVTFTAMVTGSAPTGTVAFTSDGVTIAGCGAVNLIGAGDTRTSACTTSTLPAGTHAIVATYAGNSANGISASPTLSQAISGAGVTSTTTALASLTNPSATGAAVTFTATVTGTAPTGFVAFTANSAGIPGCGAVGLAGSGNSRTAACTTSALAGGTHAIVASYGGDGGNGASASPALSQVVNGIGAVATTTTVTSGRNPSPLGAAIPLTATIASSPPVTGGTVTFTANGAPLAGCAGIPVTSAGDLRRAVCPAGSLASGAYSIVASYNGNATGQPSVSSVFSQVVPFPTIGNTLQFATSALAVNESAGSIAVMVTRIGDVSATASASYASAAATATANADFTAVVGTLSWAEGDGSPRSIVIPIAGDALAESDETFTVTLSNATGATLGAASTATVTIIDDESALVTMPGVATVVQHPYGALTVQGGTLNGNTISNLQKNAVIQLGNVAGTPGSFAKIDFQGLDIGAGNTLAIRSGAPGQAVHLVNVGGAAATIAGALQAQAGSGAPAPYLFVQSPTGLTTAASGAISGPAGLTVDTLAGTWTSGQPLVNQGIVDGGSSLQLFAAKVNGSGAFKGNAIVLASFGNLNNPVNGPHFLANGLHLYPGSGTSLDVTLAGYGAAPQIVNLMLHGNATLGMPSAWPNGSPLPPNNRPVLPGEVRAAGVADPAFGGGSMIVQATGTLALQGGASGDFVFPGGVVLKSGGALDVKGTAIDNAWTTTGAAYQGVFLEAASITDTSPTARIFVRTNNLNWANLMPRALVPVSTWTLQRQGDGSAQFATADGVAPHLNFFSITSEAGAAGACYTCLVNTQVIDLSVAP